MPAGRATYFFDSVRSRYRAVGCLNDIAPDDPLRDRTVAVISRLVSPSTGPKRAASVNDETGNDTSLSSIGDEHAVRLLRHFYVISFLVITYGYHSTVRIWCTEV